MLRVLLVEDDEQLARNLMRFLETEQFETVLTAGQRDALKAFYAEKFDCVLLDLSLRDGDGFAVCAEIKANSKVPVIFLTASADEAATVAGFDAGGDDYIGKPFRPRELIARMKNAIRRTGLHTQLLQCQDVVIDQTRGTVTKNGTEASSFPPDLRARRSRNMLPQRPLHCKAFPRTAPARFSASRGRFLRKMT